VKGSGDWKAVADPLSARLLDRLRRVRRDAEDAEAIHDARVAARRLWAAAELWRPDAEEWAGLRRRLPKLIRRMGRVRNLDVTLELLARGKPADREARRALAASIRRRRKKRRARLSKRMRKLDLAALRRKLRALSAAPARDPSRPPGPRDLGIHFTRIAALAVLSPWSEQASAAHEVRREVRLLRYAHETLEAVYPPPDFEAARRKLRSVQETAGRLQDRRVLERAAARALRKGGLSVLLDPLLGRVRREARALARRFALDVAALMELRPRMTGEGAP